MLACLNLANALSSVPHEHTFAVLHVVVVPAAVVTLIANMYKSSSAIVRVGDGETGFIGVGAKVRQGCPLSPVLFNLAI